MTVGSISRPLRSLNTRNPEWHTRLKWLEGGLLALGVAAIVAEHGVNRFETVFSGEVGVFSLLTMGVVSFCLFLFYTWSLERQTFLAEHRSPILVSLIWVFGLPFAALWSFGANSPMPVSGGALIWSEFALVVRSILGLLRALRRIEGGTASPVLVFVTSFVALITVGTFLLMLPVSKARDAAETVSAPWLVALFTSASAACVTGLTVVDTGTYWSPVGQFVIAILIQVGGLGIMTFAAFYGLMATRGFGVRENVFLGNLLEASDLARVRQLVITILVFTFVSEAIGAVILSSLWPELPPLQRFAYGAFHSISAFCNAGFAIPANGLEGYGHRIQVWGAVSALVIVGGLGFNVVQDTAAWTRDRILRWREPSWSQNRLAPRRMTLTARVVLGTTLILLALGAGLFFVMERSALYQDMPLGEKLSQAWFQSVTCRTAGFNTVDISQLHPASKLLCMALMFVGASPGGTGGGVKTTVTAIAVLGVWTAMRGRDRLEIGRRTIPDALVKRSAAILACGLGVVFTATFMIALFENQPERFLDHLFEATSAFGTVGLSTGITSGLHDASKLILVLTMFVGRVGPLTLLLAVSGRKPHVQVEFPQERVCIG
jgi:trk system potassium uptake protein TrkH